MGILAAAGALLAAVGLCAAARLLHRFCKNPGTVAIPWSAGEGGGWCVLANRSRTRDGSRLAIREPGYCALIFMKRPLRCRLDLLLFDWITGGAGAFSVGLDCSHEAGGRPWIVTSHFARTRSWQIDGPHFAPLAACAPAGFVAVDISRHVDVAQLLADLTLCIRNRRIRHRGPEPFSYLLGRTPPDRMTCSGFIGQAILRQPSSSMAAALRQALRERFTYGEIAPADLARAVAILALAAKGSIECFRKVSVWHRLRRDRWAAAELRCDWK